MDRESLSLGCRAVAFPTSLPEFPLDLRDWANAETVSSWVVETVDGLAWSNPLVVSHLQRHPDYHPRALLRVLVYAYATGCTSSQTIAELCLVEAEFAQMCHGAAPFADELLRFRRRNRLLLESVLAAVYRRALAARTGQFRTSDVVAAADRAAVSRLDLARHQDSPDC
jgi:hypothetical protein